MNLGRLKRRQRCPRGNSYPTNSGRTSTPRLIRHAGRLSPPRSFGAARESKHNKTSPALAAGESPGAGSSLRSEAPRAGPDTASATPFTRHPPPAPPSGARRGKPRSRLRARGLRTARSRERAEPLRSAGDRDAHGRLIPLPAGPGERRPRKAVRRASIPFLCRLPRAALGCCLFCYQIN